MQQLVWITILSQLHSHFSPSLGCKTCNIKKCVFSHEKGAIILRYLGCCGKRTVWPIYSPLLFVTLFVFFQCCQQEPSLCMPASSVRISRQLTKNDIGEYFLGTVDSWSRRGLFSVVTKCWLGKWYHRANVACCCWLWCPCFETSPQVYFFLVLFLLWILSAKWPLNICQQIGNWISLQIFQGRNESGGVLRKPLNIQSPLSSARYFLDSPDWTRLGESSPFCFVSESNWRFYFVPSPLVCQKVESTILSMYVCLLLKSKCWCTYLTFKTCAKRLLCSWDDCNVCI